MLVRDVAYNGLPKADRARLHERFADWLDGEPNAPDEIVGYHLEQAYRYRAELGPPNRRAKQLAADAGARLGAAGMRAWKRGDMPATINLLGRATSLLPEDDAWRRELLCELGVAFVAAGDTRARRDDSTQRWPLRGSQWTRSSACGRESSWHVTSSATRRERLRYCSKSPRRRPHV